MEEAGEPDEGLQAGALIEQQWGSESAEARGMREGGEEELAEE